MYKLTQMSNESLLGYQNDSGLRFFKSGSRRTAKMSALVNLPPDVPQDMEQEEKENGTCK